jgi:hypothetical protein
MELTWEQKAEALNALAEIEIHMRRPGNWYVHQGVEIKKGGILHGQYGNGVTPEAAILDHWHVLVEQVDLPDYLVVNAYGGDRRRAVFWNGYRWADVAEPKADAT